MKNSASRVLAVAVAAGALLVGQNALAAAGDWIIRGGVTMVTPNDDSGEVIAGGPTGSKVSVGNDVKPSFTITYMLTDNLGVELIGALPFEHEVDVEGGALAGMGLGPIADVKHLPPTLSLQYHFPLGQFRPYVGAGINYTMFFEEKVTDPTLRTMYDKISLKDSFGYALQVGVDYDLGNNWLLNADVRYIDIETEARLSGASGTATVDNIEINPVVFTLAVGKRF